MMGNVQQYSLRNQFVVSCLVGLGHAFLIFGLTDWLGLTEAYFQYPSNTVIYGYSFVGFVLIGIVVILAALRFSLLTPAVAVVTVLIWTVASTYSYFGESQSSGLGPVDVPIGDYLLFWPLILGWGLLVGVGEYLLRTDFEGFHTDHN